MSLDRDSDFVGAIRLQEPEWLTVVDSSGCGFKRYDRRQVRAEDALADTPTVPRAVLSPLAWSNPPCGVIGLPTVDRCCE
ncbi:MAG: hypothetical protein ACE5HE_03850 [Phycisphaerae bacterium]